MNRIQQNCIVPSAAFSVPHRLLKRYVSLPERLPSTGDLIFGEVVRLGHHATLESASARIHTIHDRTHAIFVFGNRYAPDHYEGLVPEKVGESVDLLARSGIVGEMRCHNEMISSPTRIRVLGYVCDE